MAASVTDVVSAQLEVVLPQVQALYDKNPNPLAKLIQKTSKVTPISRYFMRVPLELYAGGTFAKYNMDGGALPNGSNMGLSHIQAAYYASVLMFQVTSEQIETSKDKNRSVINVLSRTLANAVIEQQVMDAITLHTDGSGILTNTATAYSDVNYTLTFGGASDYLKVNLVRPGSFVSVWNSTTKKTKSSGSDLFRVLKVDWDNSTVYLDGVPSSGFAIGDYLTFPGMDIGTVSPSSFQSGYPGTPIGGVGGDSFRHGIPYWTDPTTSNYFYGKLKSDVPQLLPVSVNAGGGTLEWDHGFRLIAKIAAKRSQSEDWGKLVGNANMAQKLVLHKLGISISSRLFNESYGKTVDVAPTNWNYEDTFNFVGIPCYLSKYQDRSRIDFFHPQKVGKAEVQPLGYFKDPISGRYTFEGRSSTGALASYIEFGLTCAFDYVCFDSGVNGRIYGLKPPDDYDA